MLQESDTLEDQNDQLISSNKDESNDSAAIISLNDNHGENTISLQSFIENEKKLNPRQSLYLNELESRNYQRDLTAQQKALIGFYFTDSRTYDNGKKQIVPFYYRSHCRILFLVLLVTVAIIGVFSFSNKSIKNATSAPSHTHQISTKPTSNFSQTVTTLQRFTSIYSLLLSINSQIYRRDTTLQSDVDHFVESNYEEVQEYYHEKNEIYYYETISINVNQSGYHNIISNSTINTYGYIYNNSFDPLNPSLNLLIEDDDNGGNEQFQLTYYFLSKIKYILVTTTHSTNVTGSISIIGSGPGQIIFSDTKITRTSLSTTIQTTTPSSLLSKYSSELNFYSETYCRTYCSSNDNFYYESIEIHVNKDGFYTISSSSDFDTYGYIYNNSFDPIDRQQNLLLSDDDSAGYRQFKFKFFIQTQNTYVLIVTSYSMSTTGNFVINGFGPSRINFNRITTYRTTTTTTTTTSTTQTTSPWSVESTYSSSWTLHSQMYCRTSCEIPSYYYEIVKIRVSRSDIYSIASKSATDTYGYIYSNNFDPLNPSLNLLVQDDDSGGNRQFKLTNLFQTNGTYILVITTYRIYETGEFSISASGPGSVTFYS